MLFNESFRNNPALLHYKGVHMAVKKIILGGGCFWCIEAVYTNVKGVQTVISGYAGGSRANPTYEQICSGATGHAEVVEVTYEDTVVSLETLLDIFWVVHDPTTLNRQGADTGTQYRSVIYYSDEHDKETIQNSLQKAAKKFQDPIVTEIAAAPAFYAAETYHQHYFENNPQQGYCQAVVAPKVAKFIAAFPEKTDFN
jgi:peptide-methionine (S)-S-oxide reductase